MVNRSPIREARLHAVPEPLSRVQLAALAGVSHDTVRRAELGIRISELSQERIARALGEDRSVLFPIEDQEASA